MTTLQLQLAPSFPASTTENRGFRSRFQQLSLTEVWILLVTLAILLCLLVCAPLEQHHQSLDERAMLSAMLAAGGMPLVYSPPALCTAPTKFAGFKQTEMRTLVRN